MCASTTMVSLKFPLQDPLQAVATAATTTLPQFLCNWSVYQQTDLSNNHFLVEAQLCSLRIPWLLRVNVASSMTALVLFFPGCFLRIGRPAEPIHTSLNWLQVAKPLIGRFAPNDAHRTTQTVFLIGPHWSLFQTKWQTLALKNRKCQWFFNLKWLTVRQQVETHQICWCLIQLMTSSVAPWNLGCSPRAQHNQLVELMKLIITGVSSEHLEDFNSFFGSHNAFLCLWQHSWSFGQFVVQSWAWPHGDFICKCPECESASVSHWDEPIFDMMKAELLSSFEGLFNISNVCFHGDKQLELSCMLDVRPFGHCFVAAMHTSSSA